MYGRWNVEIYTQAANIANVISVHLVDTHIINTLLKHFVWSPLACYTV